MKPGKLEELADEIIAELDEAARDYDFDEYGLPVSDKDSYAKMKQIVVNLIRRQKESI